MAGQIQTDRRRELFIRKSTRVAASYLNRTKALSEMPDAAKPFFDVLENTYIKLVDIQKPEDMKSIGTLCVMVPAELVYAAGAMPVRLCSGSYTAYSIGDDYIPRDACPLVKAVMGFGEIKALPVFDHCSLLIAPVTCDCKKKLSGVISSLKDTVPLQIPPLKKEDADTEVFLRELYRLVPILEKETGRQITPQSLAEGIRMVGEAQYEMSEFLKYRKHDPALLHGTQVMAIMNAYAYMPADVWAGQMHKLNLEMKIRLSQERFVGRPNQPRILVTGSPISFPNLKIPLLIEEMGGILAADETCMGERGLYDPASVIDPSFDGMMRALASRYTKPCTCPVFVDNSQRVYRIKQMIKEHRIQSVVYHVLRGCLVYDYEYQIMEDELGKLDIPIIRVESDYNEEDVEQLRIRIEAFIELIKLKEICKAKGDVTDMGKYYLGLDGGSTYLKAALLKDRKVVSTLVLPTGIDNSRTAKKIVAALCKKFEMDRSGIGYIMATGYSRKILDVADDDISEITAHAYGVRVTAPKGYRPGMVVDIGGQDSKIIYLDANYNVKNFTMNDKCAAGTGKFMEVIAQILETTIDQVGPLSLESAAPCDINSTCVVFAQSEVISLVARKFDRRDILAGMHLSMAKRIIKMMKKSEKGGDILMTGGGALNTGIHRAFEEEMMKDVYVAKYPQFNGAVGAALIASERGGL